MEADERRVQKALAAKQIQAYQDAAKALMGLVVVAKRYDKKVINKRFFDEVKAGTGLSVNFETTGTGAFESTHLNISFWANDRYVSDEHRSWSIPYTNIACERAGWGAIRTDDASFFGEGRRLEAKGLIDYLKRGASYLSAKAKSLEDGLGQMDRYLEDQARIYAAHEAFRREVSCLGSFSEALGLGMVIPHNSTHTARATAERLGLADIGDPAEAFVKGRDETELLAAVVKVMARQMIADLRHAEVDEDEIRRISRSVAKDERVWEALSDSIGWELKDLSKRLAEAPEKNRTLAEKGQVAKAVRDGARVSSAELAEVSR
jgi:hypothetical protein